jgi:ATP-dependent 26S proteasome regulatory subunit
MRVDPSLTFDSIGGLQTYVQALKEMVYLPLMYPEVFDRFKVTPPR